MKAGRLDRRVTLYRPVTVRDEFNTPISDWLEVATVAASRSPISDGERMRAGQVEGLATHRFQIRWDSRFSNDIDNRWQLACEGRRYGIDGEVKELGRRVGHEISAVARTERV